MLDENTVVKVTNRENGTVGYTIPDLNNLHRNFESGETKDITINELKKLSYVPGGDIILRECLVIKNAEAVAEILGKVEPEYNYTEKEVMYLLEKGTIDEFMDALDFAPKGVVDLIKDLAIKTKLNDVAKRKAILEKTGLNVDRAVQIEEETEENDNQNNLERRTAPITTTNTTETNGRRTNPATTTSGKYNIVSTQK